MRSTSYFRKKKKLDTQLLLLLFLWADWDHHLTLFFCMLCVVNCEGGDAFICLKLRKKRYNEAFLVFAWKLVKNTIHFVFLLKKVYRNLEREVEKLGNMKKKIQKKNWKKSQRKKIPKNAILNREKNSQN